MSVIREWREIVRAGKTPIFYKAAAEVKAGLFRLRVRRVFLSPSQALGIVVLHDTARLLAPAEGNAFAAEQRVSGRQVTQLKRFACLIRECLLLRQGSASRGFLRTQSHCQRVIRLHALAFRMGEQKPCSQHAQTVQLLRVEACGQCPKRVTR